LGEGRCIRLFESPTIGRVVGISECCRYYRSGRLLHVVSRTRGRLGISEAKSILSLKSCALIPAIRGGHLRRLQVAAIVEIAKSQELI